MGTRTIYSFIDKDSAFHVYKHWDGDYENSAFYIERALPYAWPLPRFEAEDFSAAFVAANKARGGGDVYLLNHDEKIWCLYKLEIYEVSGLLHIRAFENSEELFVKKFEGSFDEFKKYVESGLPEPEFD